MIEDPTVRPPSREQERELGRLSPFELKDHLIALADVNLKRAAATMLNAGRGNPNWVATTPRAAFFLLGQFSIEESRRSWAEYDDLGGIPSLDGIASRLERFLADHPQDQGAGLLRRSVRYATTRLGLGADEFVFELTDAVIGDDYPLPVRMLRCVEKVVHEYLVKELCAGQRPPGGDFDLFAVEGGTPVPTPTPTPTPPPTSSTGTPYAPALSSYTTLAQSYSASDIINDGWAQDANNTNEGNTTCPVANTTYSSSLDAVVLTTTGQPSTNTAACAHIRSQYTVPTSGDVVEAKIWLPSLSSAQTFDGSSYPAGTLTDWATMWTDGANSTDGAESWPADTEVDAVETQYGQNYLTDHYSTGTWTTLPQGWAGAGATYATPNPGVANVQPGWNVVDIEFTSTVANVYFNGALFITIPGSDLSHNPAYLNFGISGSNGNDPNNPTWPSGPGTEDVQYVKVFS